MNRGLLSGAHYADPAVWAAERERVFGRDWLVLGALAALPDQHATATTVAGLPVVLRRDGERVHGFVNVCRHRGGPLVWDGQTEACARLRCRYHGWQYDDDGQLVRAPHFTDALPDARLARVHTHVWRGLVFGSFAEQPAPIGPCLAELDQAAGALDWTDYVVGRQASHELACNWKTYAENYLEGYHIPFLHPTLAREVELRDYAVEVGDAVIRHVVPAGPDAVYDGLWAFIWPNTAINVYQGGLSLERIVPLSPGRMRIDYSYLFDPATSDASRERSIAMSTEVTDEDRQICEALQVAYESGRYVPGTLSSRHEQGVLAFQRRVLAALG